MKLERSVFVWGGVMLLMVSGVLVYCLVPVQEIEVTTGDFIKKEEKSDLISGFYLTGGDEKPQMPTQDASIVSSETTYPSRYQESAMQHGANIESPIKTADQVPFCDGLSEQEQQFTQCQVR